MAVPFYEKALERAKATGETPRRALMLLMLERLSAQSLPDQLVPAFEFAVEYWTSRGSLDSEDVYAWKAYVWTYIEAAFPEGDDVDYREGRLARGVVGVLCPEGEVWDNEPDEDMAEWFDIWLKPLE